MANAKKSKKARRHLALRVIKFIVIMLLSAVMIAAIIDRIRHYYWHITH